MSAGPPDREWQERNDPSRQPGGAANPFAQRVERVRRTVRDLSHWQDRASVPVSTWVDQDGRPVRASDVWVREAEAMTLRAPGVVVPDGWDLGSVRLRLPVGGEGVVRLRHAAGESVGRVDWAHRDLPVPARRFDVELVVRPRGRYGRLLPGSTLAGCAVVVVEPAVGDLVELCRAVVETVAALPDDDVAEPLLALVEDVLRDTDWPSGTPEVLSRVGHQSRRLRALGPEASGVRAQRGAERNGPAVLAPAEQAALEECTDRLRDGLALLRGRFPKRGAFTVLGHAHLDVEWLWSLPETRDKAVSMFAGACDLLDRFPDYRWAQPGALLHDLVEHDDPALFARVVAAAREGRWEPVGGMWVEPDVVLAGGEGLVRQLVKGQRYFLSRFGRCCEVGWLPDSFGFSATLPTLLVGAGMRWFFTTKLRMNDTTRFPYDAFWWSGLDGSRVLVAMSNGPDGYNGSVEPDHLLESWRALTSKHRHGEGLLCLSHGGGTPPDETTVRRAGVAQELPVVPQVRFRSAREHFADLEQDLCSMTRPAPAWHGQLYLETHRGTYTSQGRTKSRYRRASQAVVAAETLTSLAAMVEGTSPRRLDHLWDAVLEAEFHDVLPGTSIAEVHRRHEERLAEAEAEAERVLTQRLTGLLGTRDGEPGVALFNPSTWDRPLRFVVPEAVAGAQRTELGWVVAHPGRLGALTCAAAPAPVPEPAGAVSASCYRLENELLVVELDERGRVSSVYDKEARREVLEGPGNVLRAYRDRPARWDAWDLEEDYSRAGVEIDDVVSATVVEDGPHRAALRFRYRFRDSAVEQDVRLWAHSRRVDFATRFDWHDRTWLVRTSFPLRVGADTATLDCAFGVTRQSTLRNTAFEQARFEVPGQSFCDLSEPGYGVALLNDGRHGYSARDNELGLSLLRSPLYPDPLADEGASEVTYALLPHPGDWSDPGSEVLVEAADLNRPLVAAPMRLDPGRTLRPLELSGLPVALSTLKPAENGDGLVLRLYEPRGARGDVGIALPAGWRVAGEADLLERPLGPAGSHVTPYAIRTLLLDRSGAGAGS